MREYSNCIALVLIARHVLFSLPEPNKVEIEQKLLSH